MKGRPNRGRFVTRLLARLKLHVVGKLEVLIRNERSTKQSVARNHPGAKALHRKCLWAGPPVDLRWAVLRRTVLRWDLSRRGVLRRERSSNEATRNRPTVASWREKPVDERGQTVVDFGLALPIIVSIVGIVLLVIGSVSGGVIDTTGDSSMDADRLAQHLVTTELADTSSPQPYTIDGELAEAFFVEETVSLSALPKADPGGVKIAIREVDSTEPTYTRASGVPTPLASSTNVTATLDGEIVTIEVTTWP